MNLILSNQDKAKQQIAPKLLQMRAELEKRKEVWDRVPIEGKEKWIASGKDPIMNIALDIYKYLRKNFFSEGLNV